VRFIEYMDVGGATDWSLDRVVPGREVLERIARERGPIEALPRDSAPAARYRCEDGTVFGLIASTTAPFCGSCDRSRLTSDASTTPSRPSRAPGPWHGRWLDSDRLNPHIVAHD